MRIGPLCALLLVLTLAGCGGGGVSKMAVEGTVTFDGEPVKSGNISFMPTDGTGATAGGEIVDGKYSVEIVAGEKRVEIVAERGTGEKLRRTDDDPSSEYEVTEQYIPAEYNSESTLTVTVGADSLKHDFALESKGGGG